MNKITSGTKEWADTNINIFHGCSNDCIYCYAKMMAIRFGRKTKENWKEMTPNFKAQIKRYKKRKGRIMFPTSHDITEGTMGHYLMVLERLVKAGNSVLITTKPLLEVVKLICHNFVDYKDQILFRFTITSISNDILKEYEPNAPTWEERLAALSHAYTEKWKTSISIEPFLDKSPIPLIYIVAPYTTDTIWIGKLNYMKRDFNSWSNIKTVLKDITTLPEHIQTKIRLKDSIRIMVKKKNFVFPDDFIFSTKLKKFMEK